MNKLSVQALRLGLTLVLSFGIAFNAFAQKDIMLVLDNSGSMRKNDPQFLARGAVATFIDHFTEDTRAGVLIFDQGVKVPIPLIAVDNASKQTLIASLNDINYRGQLTDSPAAIERAIYELKTNGRATAEKLIVFITDGIVDTGNAEADIEKTKWLRDELAVDALEHGIKVFAIAFTENADFFLIQSLAKKTGGEYYRALTAANLAEVFDTVHTAIYTPLVATPAEVPPQPPVDVTPVTPITPDLTPPPTSTDEEPAVAVTPLPADKIESNLLPEDDTTAKLLASLSEDELLALKDISEQTGIPIEQLASELVDAPADGSQPGNDSGAAPIIAAPGTAPTDEEVETGILILGAAAIFLLVLAVFGVWFIRRPRQQASAAAPKSGAGAAAAIPEAFIKDTNHYTDHATVQLGEKPMMVGRVAGTDTQHLDYLVVNKGTVGRRHAIIKYKDYSFWIVDQGSVNGTYINGDRLSGERQLKHGDKIRFHKYDFEYSQPEMDDGFHTVFADPNAADATIVATAATLAATVVLDLRTARPGTAPAEDADDLFGADDSVADHESPAAKFADSEIFDITGENEFPAAPGAGDATMEEATAIFDAPPPMSAPADFDESVVTSTTVLTPPGEDEDMDKYDDDFSEEDDNDEFGVQINVDTQEEDDDEEFGVEINLDTVGADDHPSLILNNPPGQSPSKDFDAEASAFFEDITVGPTPDDEAGPTPGSGDDLFELAPADEQAELDAKLERASAILEGRSVDSNNEKDFGEMATVAFNEPPKRGVPDDVTLDKFIETDSFDAPATIPPANPKAAVATDPNDVSLEAFMSTSIFESGSVKLTNEDATVLPGTVPDKPRDSDEYNPLAGDTVVLPSSPLAKRRNEDDDNDTEDPTVMK